MSKDDKYVDNDHLIHIPEKDYIDKKTWWGWILTLLIVPSLLGIFTAGKLFNRLEAAETKAKEAATKSEVVRVEESLGKDIEYLKAGQRRLEQQQQRNHKEILEILKK